jgi:hypothetical protein
VKRGELVVELVVRAAPARSACVVGSRTGRAVFQSSASVWATAWPTPTCRRMSNIQLAVHAAWHMRVQVGLLQPVIGRELQRKAVKHHPVYGTVWLDRP